MTPRVNEPGTDLQLCIAREFRYQSMCIQKKTHCKVTAEH